MSTRKPYTVKNNRPRRHISLLGRTLKPGGGRTSEMDLTEEELLSAPCARLLGNGRLKLLRAPALVPLAVVDLAGTLLEGSSVAAATPTSPPAPVEEELNDVEEAAEDDEEDLEEAPAEAFEEGAPKGTEGGGDGDDDPEVVDEAPAEAPSPKVDLDPLTDIKKVWGEDELYSLNAYDQKIILRSRELKLTGKEADRVGRILDAQVF